VQHSYYFGILHEGANVASTSQVCTASVLALFAGFEKLYKVQSFGWPVVACRSFRARENL